MATEKRAHVGAIIIFATVVIVAVITNPDEKKHMKAVTDLSYPKLSGQDKLGKSSDSAFAQSMAKAMVTDITEILQKIVSVDNYVLFSFTNLKQKDGKEIVGIGAFGNIFLYDEFKSRFR